MKPTRNIVPVNRGLWTTQHKPWYFKNDDAELGKSYAEQKLEEIRKDPEGFKKRTAKLVRETNKLAREEGYGGGWKHFAKENKE